MRARDEVRILVSAGVEAARPPSKKSKFRERAEQAKQRVSRAELVPFNEKIFISVSSLQAQGRSESDPYEEMERRFILTLLSAGLILLISLLMSNDFRPFIGQDRHVTKFLAEIQVCAKISLSLSPLSPSLCLEESLCFSLLFMVTLMPALLLNQERDAFAVPPVSMAMGHTKHGFPTVHTLDLKSISCSGAPGESSGQEKTAKKSRSLFFRQFESHGAEYFGLELQTPQMNFPVKRDRVEPIRLGGRAVNVSTLTGNQMEASDISGGGLPTSAGPSDGGESGMEITVTSASDTVAVSSGNGGVATTHGEGSDGDSEMLKRQFASTASKTWER